MQLYMSGTPRNDLWQPVENRLNTHRLFSLHGDYEQPVQRWLTSVIDGISTADAYLERNPKARDLAKERDRVRRETQKKHFDDRDYDTVELVQRVCHMLDGKPHPRCILLDSGAFTAWNKGEETTVDDVKRKYSAFLDRAEKAGVFEEIWMINLDKIPGEKGRDPTPRELAEAVDISDRNLAILEAEFGERILPVFHQGEDDARMREVIDQVKGRSDYICVSPRNDVAETLRVSWSDRVHSRIHEYHSECRTHGLATTGNNMIRSVEWYSGDSAAWVQHGGYGMVDIFHGPGRCRAKPHYSNYFVSYHDVEHDKMAQAEAPVLSGGRLNEEGKHYNACSEATQRHIRERVENLGFPFEAAVWDSRVRNLVCMAEMQSFAEWSTASPDRAPQMTLFGD